jgi:hypothetical protein
MGIYIKGMEMPTGNDELRLIIHSNGQVIISHKTHYEEAEAVSIPSHGALIDRDDLFAKCPELVNGYKDITDYLVVVPAEETTTQDTNVPTTYDLLYEEGGYNSNGV